MDCLIPEKEHLPQSGKKLGLTQIRNNDQIFNLVRTVTSEIRFEDSDTFSPQHVCNQNRYLSKIFISVMWYSMSCFEKQISTSI